jgi:ribosome-associated heat shock protein Hsp15
MGQTLNPELLCPRWLCLQCSKLVQRFASFENRLTLPTMEPAQSVRLDKWLWAVRLYKSRSLAIQACQAGHVKIGGQRVKPARDVRAGEVIAALTGRLHRTVKVRALLDQRVGARLVDQFLEDLTPPEEYARARAEALPAPLLFPRGFGRPTKKARRQLEGFFKNG